MARKRIAADLSISQLEQLLQQRSSALSRLEKQRKDLQRKLDEVDRDMARIGGGPPSGRRAGGRAQNDKSLPDTVEQVFRDAGKPMKVGEIADAVLAAGYRSSSDKFRAIVNQTLIKERKRFVPTGERGMYQLKK